MTEEEYDEIMGELYYPYIPEDYPLRRRTRIWVILALEAQAGLRLKTACKLKKRDIRYDGGAQECYVKEYLPKSQSYKRLTIPTHVAEVIFFISSTLKEEDYLFAGYRGADGERRPITERAVKKILKEITDYLEIDGVSTRSFYKYFYNGPAEEDDED